MPKRTDIHTILIIGSGPIVIGQGCEFDYSGVQACRALKEEGYRVVLINSNPATIMTDPEFADATYIEPITPEAVEKILAREKQNGTPIDALLPTLGGQTGLNTGMACFDQGILTKYNVKMIGADREAIFRGEDRQVFKDLMIKIGLKVPRSGVVHTMDEARKVLADIGLPLIIRPAFTLGGTGGGIAYNVEEFEEIVQRGLDASPVTEVLIEQSVIGWKEYELEVMRDKNDNVVIICGIENLDAMGVHTGDSITVAPIQTLTDKEYQRMRDAAIAVIRAVGVETGGSNIQFGVNPENGEMVVVEMNPRVSRSSALASKATGYPIAKIAAKLAVGYTLDELPNPITSRKRLKTDDAKRAEALRRDPTAQSGDSTALRDDPIAQLSESEARPSAPAARLGDVRENYELFTSACFEPTIDYCVIKIPRWTFEKFPDADETLTTQMKSVGEAMAIGRTFKEALQKGIRSMEVKRFGFGLDKYDKWLNAQRATTLAAASESHRGTGFQPVQSAPDDQKSSTAKRTSHGLETPATGGASDKTTQGESLDHEWPIPEDKLRRKLAVPSQGRLYYIRYALKMGWSIDTIYELTKIDRWFLAEMKELVEFEGEMSQVAKKIHRNLSRHPKFPDGVIELGHLFTQAKQYGYSDVQLATLFDLPMNTIRTYRNGRPGMKPVYKLVDTCAAEFEAATPYYYSTYETPFRVLPSPTGRGQGDGASQNPTSRSSQSPHPNPFPEGEGEIRVEDEIRLTDKPKILIIGGGPNRIGQGIEFDYCCVQAAYAMRELGYESVMINSNPETVSTDYDTSDLLFFEPLTHEDILNICERLNGGSLNSPSPGRPGEGRGEGTPMGSSQRSEQTLTPTLSQGTGGGGKTTGLVKGVIVQFGGQTPLNLARGLQEAGVPIIGTSVDSLDAAGDREQFRELLKKLGLKQPENGIARSVEEARKIASEIGYPVLVRPSFVLGGRAMEIVSDEQQLDYYMANAVEAASGSTILVDKFLDAATEVDVDCLADFRPAGGAREQRPLTPTLFPRTGRGGENSGTSTLNSGTAQDPLSPVRGGEGQGEGRSDGNVARSTSPSPRPSPPNTGAREYVGRAVIIGVMEHIEEAGIHSGDSACALPPYSLPKEIVEELKRQTRELASALRVNGLMNVQYAIKEGQIYVIEVNPRASRTVPFVGKATGVPWAKIAAKVMAGKTLDELDVHELPDPKHVSVKEVVFPFSKFPGVDVILGPEMRSTGEVMGIDQTFEIAYAKAQVAAGGALPTKGTVFISVRNTDKHAIVPIGKHFADLGFDIIASAGTYDALTKAGVKARRIPKLSEGRPNIIDFIKNGQVQLLVNTPTRKGPTTDEGRIRAMSVLHKVPLVTTLTGASACARAIAALQVGGWDVRPLQEYHRAKR